MTEPAPSAGRARRRVGVGLRVRRAGGIALSVLAGALVWVALTAPEAAALTRPSAFLRVPVEGLVLGALVLAVPRRTGRWVRRWVLPPVGVLLAVLLLVRALDIAFRDVFYRPFNLLSDWRYASSGFELASDASGQVVAVLAAVGVGLALVGVLVAVPLALRRLAGVGDRHRTAARRVLVALTAVWVVAAVSRVALAPGLPVAASSTVALADAQARKAVHDAQDHAVFATAIATDPLAGADTSGMLGALRGKDVVVVFVESYGKVALGAPVVDRSLSTGTKALAAQGYSVRSAWLTSPTFGGFSWLAHSSIQSGLWVDSQQRYDQLVTTHRLTLSHVFAGAGYRTVDVVPANRHDWPEGRDFYGYDKVWDARTLGYRGPGFGYAPMPDQYTLSALDRLELAPSPRPPVFAEVDLVTSHIPWAPLPRLVDWPSLGDGSVFRAQVGRATPREVVWRTDAGVRDAYAQTVAYSLDSVVSWLSHTRDRNLVVLVLGDHQPASVVSGDNASHDVPVALLTRDATVGSRVDAWGWHDGLRPDAAAPVWPMSAVRDRILGSFR
ncbi:CDP-alcohol phosphatidyltransferase [Intrasporangium flavum]|uniref:CDP-alcohol phosphatidyltransferase n=1 Tax=Intrasporangium flavum TaxID=1428657 RepID=UPI001F60A97F|nr:CDP-alcohol phosphatidyltransferase [Intrasporangium flavum]